MRADLCPGRGCGAGEEWPEEFPPLPLSRVLYLVDLLVEGDEHGLQLQRQGVEPGVGHGQQEEGSRRGYIGQEGDEGGADSVGDGLPEGAQVRYIEDAGHGAAGRVEDLGAGLLRGPGRVGEEGGDVQLLARQLLHEVQHGRADVGRLALALAPDEKEPGPVGERGRDDGTLAGRGMRENPLYLRHDRGVGGLQQGSDVFGERRQHLVLHPVSGGNDATDGLVEVDSLDLDLRHVQSQLLVGGVHLRVAAAKGVQSRLGTQALEGKYWCNERVEL